MKNLCFALCLFVLFFSVSPTKAMGYAECSSFILSEDDLDSRYTITTDTYFDSVHPVVFYDHPDLYGILNPPQMKYFQTIIQNKSVQGTVFYYQYGSEDDAKKAAYFLKGLLWGENGFPSPSCPEEIYVINDMLLVFSFNYNSRESRNFRDAIIKKTNVDIYYGKDVQDFTEIKFRITEADSLGLSQPNSWKVKVDYLWDKRTVGITPVNEGGSFMVLITVDPILPSSSAPVFGI